MKNLISIIFLVIFSFGYAQKYPKTIIIENDSIICFTTTQSKQLGVWNEERKQCQELRILDAKEIIKKDGVIYQQNEIINKQDSIIFNYRSIIVEKEKIITINEEERKLLKKEIRTQKVGKWIAIISGVLLSGLMLAI
jgi:hypothetical protein